ncbi:hypothetical protein [Sedimentibacter sp. MB31-C6]|uniref:hypothetical protein n=1 Tax=Sedimentibacter sp. MB31-C6 TaxID=3109366 RepID=UPI002DDD1E78|nr:hypothetical protein [Sedimentibacter sp. MB36-C1]WSI02862.1 hypothetical protein U8307_07345 [Sedimentibacter sp. MB36-C1]
MERDIDDFYKYYTLKLIKYKSGTKNTTPVDVPAEPTTVTAEPTNSKVIVNGKVLSFDAYNIDNNNYFKLRDLASVVNNSEKQFEVKWDNKNAINLISNTAYTTVGGELSKGNGKSKTGNLNTSKIYKDSIEVQLSAYNINNNNYFKLRDVAKIFNIGITWDSETSTVGIDTSIGYVEP